MADRDPPKITAEQSRAARGLLDWSQQQLGEAAELSAVYVRKFEKGDRNPSAEALKALRDALEAAGVEFIPENGGGAGVRLMKRSKLAAPKVKAKAGARSK